MNVSPVFSHPSSEANGLTAYARVKITGNGAELAGAEDRFVGTNIPGDLNREQASIQTKACGVHFAIASEAIANGAEFQGAADGEIAALDAGTPIGVALEAAAADGDCIRVVYY